MSVSGELLCSFELLKPLDSTALKNHIKKGRNKRNSMLSSPVSRPLLVRLFSPSPETTPLCNNAEASVPWTILASSALVHWLDYNANVCSLQLSRHKATRGPGNCMPSDHHPPYVTIKIPGPNTTKTDQCPSFAIGSAAFGNRLG